MGGKTTLSSTQALTALYSLSASDFHDITSGYNGYFATQGYDLVTGLGTPVANRVIADLVSANFVSGGSATSQVSRPVAHGFTRRTSPRLDVTSSPANGTENSSSLLGSGQFAGALIVQALGTQVGITQAQPVVNQAVIATQITQAPARLDRWDRVSSNNHSTRREVRESRNALSRTGSSKTPPPCSHRRPIKKRHRRPIKRRRLNHPLLHHPLSRRSRWTISRKIILTWHLR